MKLNNNEKIKLVMGKDDWYTNDLGGKLYNVRVSDATIGMRCPVDAKDWSKGTQKSIAYPSVQVLANTWDNELSYRLGAAVANDAIDLNVDVILGPGVNIKRNPLCGRNFEYFSEDPLLAGFMAREYIKGAQDNKVGTCIKHYCCNNIEYARHWSSSNVDEITLNEIYLRQFKIALEAKPYSIMCSYNLVNGTRMSENTKLYDKLYNEFNFDGIIISDWCAVKNATKTINSGLSLIMPYEKRFEEELESSLNENKIDLDVLDKSVDRMLHFVDICKNNHDTRKTTMSKEDRENLSQTICENGCVLLKNNGVLPLKGNEKIVVSGAATVNYYYGGGSSNVIPNKDVLSLHDALLKNNINNEYVCAIHYSDGHQTCMDNLPLFIDKLKENDVAIIGVGDTCSCECEGRDRQTIKLSKEENDLILFAKQTGKKVIVIVYAGAAIDMSLFVDKVDAILYVGYGGQYVNEAITNILTGKTNPSGKLTETFPLSMDDINTLKSHYDAYGFDYDEGLFVGYRYYNTNNIKVLFPFGYGLSYSKFEYKNLEIVENNDNFELSFDVTNVSDVDGKEISQAYVRLENNKNRPLRELKGYTKTFIKAHQTKNCKITIRKQDLEFYDENKNICYFCNNPFIIEIGTNVNEILLSKKM